MKKLLGISLLNWIEVVLLLIINYKLDVDTFLHICILGYAFVRFIHGIIDINFLWKKVGE